MQNGHHFILNISAQKPVLFETKNELAEMKSVTHPKILIVTRPSLAATQESLLTGNFPSSPNYFQDGFEDHKWNIINSFIRQHWALFNHRILNQGLKNS